MAPSIRAMREGDGAAVLAVYGEGIATGHATFEHTVPDWTRWQHEHLPQGRFVAESDGRVVGWAALAPTSHRPVYAGVADISIYIAAAARGTGIGRRLYAAAIEASEQAGIWTLVAGIFPENAASLALHRRAGFRIVGRRERIGRMAHGPLAGQWRDVLLLERRSARAGTG